MPGAVFVFCSSFLFVCLFLRQCLELAILCLASVGMTGTPCHTRILIIWKVLHGEPSCHSECDRLNSAEEVPCPLESSCISAQLRSPLQWFLCGAVPRVVARGQQRRRGDWEPDMLAQRVGTSGLP